MLGFATSQVDDVHADVSNMNNFVEDATSIWISYLNSNCQENLCLNQFSWKVQSRPLLPMAHQHNSSSLLYFSLISTFSEAMFYSSKLVSSFSNKPEGTSNSILPNLRTNRIDYSSLASFCLKRLIHENYSVQHYFVNQTM